MSEDKTIGGAIVSANGILYTGTKTLKAWPRTLGEYNKYRGWDIPKNEDPDKPGYMVEYAPDEVGPNVEGHAGYVSWSPASVFETTYKEVPADWRGRVEIERDELVAKLEALRNFVATSQYADLPQNAKGLLQAQADVMHDYQHVLQERLDLPAPTADEAEPDLS